MVTTGPQLFLEQPINREMLRKRMPILRPPEMNLSIGSLSWNLAFHMRTRRTREASKGWAMPGYGRHLKNWRVPWPRTQVKLCRLSKLWTPIRPGTPDPGPRRGQGGQPRLPDKRARIPFPKIGWIAALKQNRPTTFFPDKGYRWRRAPDFIKAILGGTTNHEQD